MKHISKFLYVPLFLFLLSATCFAQRKDMLFSFCQFKLDDALVQGNISFSESFLFSLDENNKPSKIKRVVGKYLKEDVVQACIDNWTFAGFPKDTKIIVMFSWKHGYGWTQMQVSSKGFYRRVLLSKDCP